MAVKWLNISRRARWERRENQKQINHEELEENEGKKIKIKSKMLRAQRKKRL